MVTVTEAPEALGVKLFTLKAHVAPIGKPAHDNEVELLNPLKAFTIAVSVVVLAAFTAGLLFTEEIEKSVTLSVTGVVRVPAPDVAESCTMFAPAEVVPGVVLRVTHCTVFSGMVVDSNEQLTPAGGAAHPTATE